MSLCISCSKTLGVVTEELGLAILNAVCLSFIVLKALNTIVTVLVFGSQLLFKTNLKSVSLEIHTTY